MKSQHINNDVLTKKLDELSEYTIITNDETNLNGKKCNYDPDIESIVNKYVDKAEVNPHLVNPEYLKLTEAEESRM